MNESIKYDFCFFADQDDFWHENKILFQLEMMYGMNPHIPCLISCRYDTISANGSLLNAVSTEHSLEFWELIVRTPFPGCSMAFNLSLSKLLVKSILPVGVMHDRWVCILARIHGTIMIMDQSLLGYRIHDANTVGISTDPTSRLKRFFRSTFDPKKVGGIYSCIPIAESLSNNILINIPKDDSQILDFLSYKCRILYLVKILWSPIKYKNKRVSLVVKFLLLLHIILSKALRFLSLSKDSLSTRHKV
jgi:hypothetical protein